MNVDHARTDRFLTTRAGSAWFAPGFIFIGCCLLYLINLERAPHPDELYHVLAARGLLEHGEPRIAEGLYTRVFAYTWLVAQMFALFGESLAAARLPSLFAIAALNTLLFVWLRKEANARAAWIAAGLFAISPFAVEIAQFARFYALQNLFFFAGCLAVYEVARKPLPITPRSIILGLVAVVTIAFAVYLQPTTFLGIAGLGLWLGSILSFPWLLGKGIAPRRRLLMIGAGLVGAALVVGLLLATGLWADFWHRYRWTPPFNAPHIHEFWYYHVYYLIFYPTLWPLIGLLSLAALATHARLAWFVCVIFATGFLLNSFAGPKSLRYLSYAQPFIFIVFGLGLAALLPWMFRAFSIFKQQLEVHLAELGLAGWRLPDVALWGSLLIVLLANAAFLRTVSLLANITVPPGTPDVQWQQTLPSVEPLLNKVDVVVTMAELETLYFWKRYDILFSPSRLSEMADQAEFALDHRTGRSVISTTESLGEVFKCTATGMFIAPVQRWRRPQFIEIETVNFIEQKMTRLDLPSATQLMLFVWDHPSDPGCPPSIEQLRDGRG